MLFFLEAYVKHFVLSQGSATFWTSGPHSVPTRFQQAATILADQKLKVFVKNSALFSVELKVKTKKKRSLPKLQAFFGRVDGEDPKKQNKKGLRQKFKQ